MKIGFQTLCPITQQEKDAIIKDISVPVQTEEVMTVNKEVWQQVMSHLNWQAGKIQALYAEIKENSKKLDNMQSAIENIISEIKKAESGNKTDKINEKRLADKTQTTKKSRRAVTGSKSVQSKTIVFGEKIVKEITESWEEIIASVNDGTYIEKYNIGNYKQLDLGEYGIIRMQIAGFNAEEIAQGGGMAAITWMAMDLLDTVQIMYRKNLKKTLSTAGGWDLSEVRMFLKSSLKKRIPEFLMKEIKAVNKYSRSMDFLKNSIENEMTVDELWIPSVQEVFGEFSKDENSAEYYSTLFSDKDRKRMGNEDWWLRSVRSDITFFGVNSSGSYKGFYADDLKCILLCFCT